MENGVLTVDGLNLALPAQNSHHRYAAIRPEHVHLQPEDSENSEDGIVGRIRSIVNQGLFAELAVEASGVTVNAVVLTSALMARGFRQGERVHLRINPADVHLI
jgi:ABC-type Fe3+/spermidine/putrescine transport system ATPase subunit